MLSNARPFKSCFAVAFLLIALVSPAVRAEQVSESIQMIRTGPGLSLHKEMFNLPVTVSGEYTGPQTEAVFQLSAKHRIFGSPV
jgi:hypothetical protein